MRRSEARGSRTPARGGGTRIATGCGRRPAPLHFELREEPEPVEGVAPHRFEQGRDRTERVAVRPVESPPAVRARRHEPAGFERTQVLRDGAERDVAERAVDLAGRTLLAPDEAQDLAATG